jgi:hypothetical protein
MDAPSLDKSKTVGRKSAQRVIRRRSQYGRHWRMTRYALFRPTVNGRHAIKKRTLQFVLPLSCARR